MKKIGRVILAAGIIFLPQLLNAQTATTPDSIVQITAEAQGLERVPSDQVPPFGTFWLIQAETISAVPLPCPPFDPTWPIFAITPDGQYLVDGTISGQAANTSEAILAAQANAVVNLIAQVQTAAANQQARAMGADDLIPPGAEGGGGDGGDYLPAGKPFPIDTNRLWLEMITVTNKTASLVIHPPWNVSNEVYELLYSTNLLIPPTNWQWVLRSYPQETNLIVPNATDAQGFYRLSTAFDPIANSSLGTNFWLAFCGLFNDARNDLSLFISSPVGATGTIIAPRLMTDGPVLVATNCGDGSVDGTYFPRNLTAREQLGWATIGDPIVTNAYVKGTNWVVIYSGDCYLVSYDSNGPSCTMLYFKSGAQLNGTTNDWTASLYNPNPTNTPATICPPVLLINQTFTVAAGQGTNITIPLDAMSGDFDVVQTNGINIIASQPVSVYGLDYDPTASTAFTGYPTPLLGTNYCLMARAAALSSFHSQLAIVATETNTTVTITPSTNANLAGSQWTAPFTLQQGETYQIHSQNDPDDVTGTLVTSDKPIAVFAGADLAFVPDNDYGTGNPLMQEQMPVASWGTEALALGFAGRVNGDCYRVLAAYTNTVITVIFTNGFLARTNHAGQFLDLTNVGPVEFRASQPVQVAHFANGKDFSESPGDPCEVLVPPTGHCLMTNVVFTPEGFYVNYLNIIVAQSAITNTLVDGLPVAASNFVAIGTSGYFGAQIPVAPGLHTVRSSQPVEVEIYGFGFTDAYGYVGGIVQ